MDPTVAYVVGAVSALVACLLVYLWQLPLIRRKGLEDFREELEREARVVAKEQLYRERDAFESALRATQRELKDLEDRLRKREDAFDRRTDAIEARERERERQEGELRVEQAKLAAQTAEVERTLQRQLRELERVSGMRREEAEHLLLERVDERCKAEAEDVRARAEATLREELDARARDALLTAMQRLAGGRVREALVTQVPLDDDGLKALLVGREGRNARAFEAATGVDLLIDDTPGVVLLSAFEPVRREVARRALVRLLDEGEVHPERIEAVVAETRQEMDEVVADLGRVAAEEARVEGLHVRLLTLLGRLEFLGADGRNARRHAVETAKLAGNLAGELGLDAALARRCGLLHLVGKGVDHDVDGGYPAVGADFARRCDEQPVVVNAIAAHRGDVEPESAFAPLVQVASAATARRPGASDDQIDRAVRRRAEVEAIAQRQPGVTRAYALQAGRVLRVVVDPDKVSERQAQRLARDVARAVEAAPLPGEVQVTVVRETHARETAG